METVLKSQWVDDKHANSCNLCRQLIKSSVFKSNKHHCRYCGYITCNQCSNNTLNKNRICTECFKRWNDKDKSHALQPIPIEYWSNDPFIKNCSICHNRIKSNLFSSNKHHCRYCGCIACDGCCPYRTYKEHNLRTCNDCYETQREYFKRSKHDTQWRKKYFIYSKVLLLHGYVREFCNLTFTTFFNNEIMGELIIWLNTANETWDEMHIHPRIHFSMHNQCIGVGWYSDDNVKANVFYYIFGKNIVSNGMVITWQFVICGVDDVLQRSNISIGIVELEKRDDFKMVEMNNSINYVGYGLELNGAFFRHMSRRDIICLAAKDMVVRKGDIIIMSLDLTATGETGMLMYEIQMKDKVISKIACQPDAWREWVLAVKLRKNDKVMLMERFQDMTWHCD
eukprot:541744_1